CTGSGWVENGDWVRLWQWNHYPQRAADCFLESCSRDTCSAIYLPRLFMALCFRSLVGVGCLLRVFCQPCWSFISGLMSLNRLFGCDGNMRRTFGPRYGANLLFQR